MHILEAIALYLMYTRSSLLTLRSINVFTSCCQIAEPEADGAELDEPAQQEPDRSFCRCKSSCKTKQKNEGGPACPCHTANANAVLLINHVRIR